MTSWEQDKEWADGFLPRVQETLKELVGAITQVRKADELEDRTRATDFVLEGPRGAVACRIRRERPERFTDIAIRSKLASGAPTELDKIREGFVRWYFYAWTLGEELDRWVFLDVCKALNAGIFGRKREFIRSSDGRNWFITIPIEEFREASAVLGAKGCETGSASHDASQREGIPYQTYASPK